MVEGGDRAGCFSGCHDYSEFQNMSKELQGTIYREKGFITN